MAGVVYVFLHLPILVLVVFSFNASKFSVEWRGFTLQWYHRLLERPDILRGLKASLDRRRSCHRHLGGARHPAGPGAGAGTGSAGGRRSEGFLYVPIVTPEIVVGISLLLLFALVEVPAGAHHHHHRPRGLLHLLRGDRGAGPDRGNGRQPGGGGA